jgi:hypothetical protein
MSETLHAENETELNPKGGPRTQAGKAASSKNSFKHGLASGRILIEGEDPAAFEALVADLEADYQPATKTEALLVHDLAKFHWLADRAIRLQAEAFAASACPEVPASLNVLIRYQTSSPPVQQTDAGSKTQRTNESARFPDHPEILAGPSKGKKISRAS